MAAVAAASPSVTAVTAGARRRLLNAYIKPHLSMAMKWVTHVLWGAAVLTLARIDLATAAAAATLHTAVTDVMGHSGLRRNKYHDLISLLVAAVIATYMLNPIYLLLGLLHIFLDWVSPGRLAVSWAYNILWSLPPALILVHMY
jgi:hypothetical protein